MRIVLLSILVAMLLGASSLHDTARASEDSALDLCPGAMTQAMPSRPLDAPGGAEFMDRIRDLSGVERDEAVLVELRRGNFPEFLRELEPVRLVDVDPRRGTHEAVVCVMPDYLAVGSDDDYVRVPMGFNAAATIARTFGFTLPTRKMVDAIYQQSTVRLDPQPMRPGPKMVSTQYFTTHNAMIERQLDGRPPGELVAGHKKDLILTKRLFTRRGRVAIYGWHERPGDPIQPLSTVHGARYADYSHGVRLVSTSVVYDGASQSVYELLRDSRRAPVLTHEGTIKDATRIMGLGLRAPSSEPTD